jgi:hypothetical protein
MRGRYPRLQDIRFSRACKEFDSHSQLCFMHAGRAPSGAKAAGFPGAQVQWSCTFAPEKPTSTVVVFIRNILMYINSKGIETDLNKGIFLVAVFGVVIILLASSSSSATSCQLVSALNSRCTCQLVYFCPAARALMFIFASDF